MSISPHSSPAKETSAAATFELSGYDLAGWRSPMAMTLQAAGQSERPDWQAELVRMLLDAG